MHRAGLDTIVWKLDALFCVVYFLWHPQKYVLPPHVEFIMLLSVSFCPSLKV